MSVARERPWRILGLRPCLSIIITEHQGVTLPDGRLVIVFRDMASDSPTYGHFVAWVGTYAAVRSRATKGVYRVKLLHSNAGHDCGYPGIKMLPDGAVVAVTYIKYWNDKRKQSVICTCFRPDETDRRLNPDGASARVYIDEKGP